MKRTIHADIIVIGGGIAGLWLLATLKQKGYSVLLLEDQALGCGQSGKSQGIIHGGMKYALQGMLTEDAKAMLDMPSIWREALLGRGAIDLTHIPVLSDHHYLWSPNKLAGKLGKFFASHTLSSRIISLRREQFPSVFQHPQFKGEIFALDEIVLDVPAIFKQLAAQYCHALLKIDSLNPADIHLDNHHLRSINIKNGEREFELHAQQFIFTAGAGNEFIAKRLVPEVKTQRRPLRMTLVKMKEPYSVYAHCMGLSARPRMTITTHFLPDGDAVWYLGGMLAEEGIHRSEEEQIKAARSELTQLFPWLNWQQNEMVSFIIDRAEPMQANGFKPENTYFSTVGNITVAWPTKLAFAPKLAAEIVSSLTITPHYPFPDEVFIAPPVAPPIWETLFCNTAL